MGLLARLLGPELRADPPAPDDDFWYSPVGASSAAGVRITPDVALAISAVYCAVRILSESIAQLPLVLYRRLAGGGKERATDHPVYSLLHDQVNEEQTSFEWREMMEGHVVLRGNSYSQIERRRDGTIAALIPRHPDQMRIERTAGALRYWYRGQDGRERPLRRDQVMHLRGLSSDGVMGISPITLARETIGVMSATEGYAGNLFRNNVRPSGVLNHPGVLKPEARAHLKKSWHEAYAGPQNAGKTVILEEGMTWHEVGMSSSDAQFLETRKFQISEVARWFNLPPHMLKDLERSTFSNIEQQSLEFVLYTLLPWIRRWEQAIMRDLFDEEERKVYSVSFVVDGLLRGDALARAQALAVWRNNGIINADEWRELENMNPQEGGQGKTYLVPLNMIPADMVGEIPGKTDGVPTPAGGPGGEQKALPAPEEVRRIAEQRAITSRVRLRRSYHRLFADAAERFVRKEVAAGRRAVKQFLGQRDASQFEHWIANFYVGFEGDITRSMTPVVTSFAEAIQVEAAGEIGAKIDDGQDLKEFVGRYVENLAVRHIASSRGQLLELLSTTEANAALDEVEKRLAQWLEKRPDKITSRETVQADNAVALKTYEANGIRRKRWKEVGETCAFCQQFDGRVIAIDGSFADAGQVLQASGKEPMMIRTTKSHPPMHRGCDCIVVAA